MYKILFTASPYFEQRIDNLKIDGFEFIKQQPDLTEDELIKALVGMDGYILGGNEIATRKVIESTKNLKVIAFCGIGYQSFMDVQAATEKGIVITNTPGANAKTVAELTVGFILTAVKHIIPMNEDAKKGIWGKRRMDDLEGKTLGIVGMGEIGSKVAKIMKDGFGMKIIYHSRTEKPEIENTLGAKKVSMAELFSQSDVVSLHIPHTSQTDQMVNSEVLASMKPSAVLINTARAGLVDGNALYEALVANKLSAAAFDGYYKEPLPKPENDQYKLMSLPDSKFILTPHNGANSEEAYDAMTEMAVKGLVDALNGKVPKNKVN